MNFRTNDSSTTGMTRTWAVTQMHTDGEYTSSDDPYTNVAIHVVHSVITFCILGLQNSHSNGKVLYYKLAVESNEHRVHRIHFYYLLGSVRSRLQTLCTPSESIVGQIWLFAEVTQTELGKWTQGLLWVSFLLGLVLSVLYNALKYLGQRHIYQFLLYKDEAMILIACKILSSQCTCFNQKLHYDVTHLS